MFKKIALIVAIFALAPAAQAAVSCYTSGNTTHCSGYDRNGNYYSYSCYTSGSTTHCS